MGHKFGTRDEDDKDHREGRVILARERSERVMGEGVLRLRHKDTIVERGQLVHQVVVLQYPNL
jgi:hypothetical protein